MAREGLTRAAALAAVLGAAPLPGQGLPPLPQPGPDRLPGLGELLAPRPAPAPRETGEPVPVHFWGKDVKEGPDGWEMTDGVVESPDLLLLADHLRYHATTGELEADGHIRLEGPGVRLRCARLRMDWRKRTGEAWALDMELPPSWYLRSAKVAFTTLQHWDFEKVELSPCPQEQPGWKAQVGRLTVDLDRYATIRNLWIWVGNVPTPYFLPWAVYPAKAERTSGLLPFSLSFSGPMGASVQVPYYQVLGASADATLSPEYFTRQGVLWGGEVRWNPELAHQGSFTGQFIRQRTDDLNRYRFTFKEIWQREDGWQFAADLNRASDALLEADYGQGLARLGGTPFDSAVYLGRNLSWATFSANASEQRTWFYPDKSSPFVNSLDPTYANSLRRQVLPSLQGSLYPIPLGAFYLDAGLRLSRMDYQPDLRLQVEPDTPLRDRYSWNRDDLFVRLQGRIGQWGPLRADLDTLGRYTRYSHSLDQSYFDTSNTTQDSLDYTINTFKVDSPALDRLLGSARLQLSGPPIGRTFKDVKLFGYHAELKHVINPYFAFTLTSKASAEGSIPHFDDVDFQPGVGNSAAGERSLELGFKQHFLGRPGVAVPFLELVRWKVSARYHLEPILLNDGRVLKGWATVDNEIDVEPSEDLRVSFRRSSDLSDSDADQSVSADYKAGDGTRFNLAYFSTGINRLLVRQRGIQVGGLQRLWSDRVRLEFQANYDFNLKVFAGSQVALAYVTPCVATSLRFSHLGLRVPGSLTKEDRLDLVLTLRSLGDLGKYTF